MRLFTVGKVGVFLEALGHKQEKRKSGEHKVVVCSLRVQPFTHQLASAIDDKVRGSLFKRSGNADPIEHVKAVEFALGVERQNILCYASPDTERASLEFEFAKISHVRARTEKSVNGLALTFKATFGPVGKTELEYLQDWLNGQRFCTFLESEPNLDFLDGKAEDEGDDEPEPDQQSALPADDDDETQPAEAHV